MKNVKFDDFKKLDIRVGTVVKAEAPKWSHWVIKLKVDFGPAPDRAGLKTIFVGMLGFYKPEDFVNKQFPFVVNLEPKKIGPEGDLSEGMMLAASLKLKKPVVIADEETFEKPILLMPCEKVPNGARVR